MDHAIVLDFETANGSPSSVCSVGTVIVRDGEVVDSFYSGPSPKMRTCDDDTCVPKTVTKRNKPLIISGSLWSIGESNS